MIDTKYFGPEDHIQYKIMQWIAWEYPEILALHPFNEAKRGWAAQAKLKALGGATSKGAPDILIFNPSSGRSGLALEVKSKTGRLTKEQSFWLDALKARNWQTQMVRSFEEAQVIINEYMNYGHPENSNR